MHNENKAILQEVSVLFEQELEYNHPSYVVSLVWILPDYKQHTQRFEYRNQEEEPALVKQLRMNILYYMYSYTPPSDAYVVEHYVPRIHRYCEHCDGQLYTAHEHKVGECDNCRRCLNEIAMAKSMIATGLIDELPDDQAEYYRGIV